MSSAPVRAETLDAWAMIHSPECPLFLEKRDPPLESATLEAMLARPPAMMKYEGAPDGIAAAYANLPADLVADIADLARRFADVMGVAAVGGRCASFARAAGFDAVEIHGANGY
ncbi:MAG: hypothetical protein ACOVNS_00090, partial [Erythrobacter sp.]